MTPASGVELGPAPDTWAGRIVGAEQTVLAIPPRRRHRSVLGIPIDEYWPLAAYFYLYPLWWVLGLSKVMIFVLAVPMLASLLRQRTIRVPRGFGVYLLFLAWVGLGVTMLWVRAPGTEDKVGLGPLVGFSYRSLWYLAVTVACLYVLNADRTRLTAERIGRMLAFQFVFTTIGGLVGVFFATLDFPSLVELFLPTSATRAEFMSALFHPRIALASEFLGYTQPRVTAPYSYPNTWGNAFGLLLPFFLFTWFGRAAGWRRYVAPLILAVSFIPVVYSLNRGLWLGLAVTAAWLVLRRLVAGDVRALLIGTLTVTTLLVSLVATPLGSTIGTRLATPHSDERRQDTVSEVIRTTWAESPVLGYGGTRQMVGNFTSLAGTGAPGCHQCSAPPLGTQGYLWGLMFMTGFIGAALLVGFLLWQFLLNARRKSSLGLLASTVLLASIFYFLFYDALDLPMLVTMMTVGLAARDHAPLRPSSAEESADDWDERWGEVP